MGGKGQRRRAKNYGAAHGGDTRLPPPPDLGAVDAVPSKLRRLMLLMNRPISKQSSLSLSLSDCLFLDRFLDIAGHLQLNSGPSEGSNDSGSRRDEGITPGKRREETNANEDKKGVDEVTNASTHDKRKQKQKRKAIKDLRFQNGDQGGCLRRKQKRKEYFEARKKKQKKEKKSEISEFPKHEQVRFGEVVEAPPRLSFPKTAHDASHERRRLRAIEAYRNHKGWESRPGIHHPSITESLSP